MTTERFNSGDTIPVRAVFEDVNGSPITNATGFIFIHRTSDNQYWNGSAFQVARVSIAMAKVSDANVPGEWNFNFATNGAGANAVDNYIFEVIDTSGNAKNKIEQGFAFVGGYLDKIQSDAAKILGLMHENTAMTPVFDGAGNVISGELRQYDTKANAQTDNGTTGLLNKWSFTSPHVLNKLTKMTFVKEP
jgi:hypothetical protein